MVIDAYINKKEPASGAARTSVANNKRIQYVHGAVKYTDTNAFFNRPNY